jgi:hypothetical protein
MTFALLRRAECNVLAPLGTAGFAHARRLIIRAILATDMARHSDLVLELGKAKRGAAPDPDLLIRAFVHAADLSNHVRPFHIAKPWSDRRARRAGGWLAGARWRQEGGSRRALALPAAAAAAAAARRRPSPPKSFLQHHAMR